MLNCCSLQPDTSFTALHHIPRVSVFLTAVCTCCNYCSTVTLLLLIVKLVKRRDLNTCSSQFAMRQCVRVRVCSFVGALHRRSNSSKTNILESPRTFFSPVSIRTQSLSVSSAQHFSQERKEKKTPSRTNSSGSSAVTAVGAAAAAAAAAAAEAAEQSQPSPQQKQKQSRRRKHKRTSTYTAAALVLHTRSSF